MSALQTSETACIWHTVCKDEGNLWVTTPHLDVSLHTDPLSSHGQVTQLPTLSWRGSKGAQIFQKAPTWDAIAVQEALTCAAAVLCQVCCERLGQNWGRDESLIMGIAAQYKAIMLWMHKRPSVGILVLYTLMTFEQKFIFCYAAAGYWNNA